MKKSTYLWKSSIISLSLLILLVVSCKEEEDLLTIPSIPTAKIFSLGSNAVTLKNAWIINKKDSLVTQQGICWSKTPGPTVDNNTLEGDLKDSTVYYRIQGLTPNTKYYLRVYATNSIGTGYGEEIVLTTNQTTTDINGHVYHTVTLGTQTWMVENLRTTKYNDGTYIPFLESATPTGTILDSPYYCYYNNLNSISNDLGALYNYPAVNSGKLCPQGWHVPSDAEWTTLTEYLDGEFRAGGMLKSTGDTWNSPNFDASNYSGFYALPGGTFASITGSFFGKGQQGTWWSSTISESEWNICRTILSGDNRLIRDGFVARANAQNFLSVRCIKD